LVPPEVKAYAIYYGYTELKLDKDRDVWISFGSDDIAQVWINGQQVWLSSRYDTKPWYRGGPYMPRLLHDWDITEGSRLVHLHKGANKILFKLNNFVNQAFFSMVLW
jgi:hypothetical protein